MNAEIYRDEIVDSHIKLFRGAIGNNFNLMDDNEHFLVTYAIDDH